MSLAKKSLFCLILIALTDIIFYNQPIGWGMAAFCIALFFILTLSNKALLATPAAKIIGGLNLTLAFFMFEAPSALALAVFLLGMITLVILTKRKDIGNALALAGLALRIFLAAPLRSFKDIRHIKRLRLRLKAAAAPVLRKPALQTAAYVLLPLFMTTAFISLFSNANPLVAKFLAMLSINVNILEFIVGGHWFFWAFSGAFFWTLLRARIYAGTSQAPLTEPANLDLWVNKTSILLSLAVFNVLFALQNAMDILFLWSRQSALPSGTSYAQYAQQGAYPLIFTTLIAAAYILVTFSERSQHYQTGISRQLAYIWIAQNIFLVASAILRTMNYIEAYSLTHLRIAALLGMALISLGFLLITARIVWNKTNRWLVNTNMLALAATLYTSCFVNFTNIIAQYNVRHALEVGNKSAVSELDAYYIYSLGAEAIPALYWYAQTQYKYNRKTQEVQGLYNRLVSETEAAISNNPRAWTWHKHRLLAQVQVNELRSNLKD